ATPPAVNAQRNMPRSKSNPLEDLRQDWVEREASLYVETEAAPPKSRQKQTTIPKYAPFLDSFRKSLRETLPARSNRRYVPDEERRRGPRLIVVAAGFLTLMLMAGAWFYGKAVESILDPGKLVAMMQSDWTSPDKPPAHPAQSAPDADSNSTAAGKFASDKSAASGIDYTESDWYKAAVQSINEQMALNGGQNPGYLSTLAEEYGIESKFDRVASSHSNEILVNQTLARVLDGLARASQAQPTPREQTRPRPANTVYPPQPVASVNNRPLNAEPSSHSAGDDLVRAGQASLQNKDLAGAARLAGQAKALDPTSVPALELMQVTTAASGNPRDAEAAALQAIAHGGKAVFELQHFHASPLGLHPARIVITATTLEFIPEGPCEAAPFTLPLTSIASVEMGQNAAELSGLYLLNIEFKFAGSRPSGARATPAELSFTGSSSRLHKPNAAQASRQLSSAQETALLTAIRNVLLAEKGRS
ncbi:MAG TPA: hypothetical protein VF865_21670, partial [Acidobacteriaceae bacterium]